MISINDIEKRMENYEVGVIGDRKEFSVLIPVINSENGPEILYEVRSKDIRQPGDVCFPGGKMEKGESSIETALRETFEEIGIAESDIRILGRFDSMLEVNRLRMHTVVGIIEEETVKRAILSEGEVSEIFTVPIEFLKSNPPDYFRGRILQDDTGFPYEKHGIDPNYKWREAYQDLYFWHYEGHTIWGLTAAITEWFILKMYE